MFISAHPEHTDGYSGGSKVEKERMLRCDMLRGTTMSGRMQRYSEILKLQSELVWTVVRLVYPKCPNAKWAASAPSPDI